MSVPGEFTTGWLSVGQDNRERAYIESNHLGATSGRLLDSFYLRVDTYNVFWPIRFRGK